MKTQNEINQNIFDWAKTNLEHRAVKEWKYQSLDFDPLINLLFGAFASEFKEVYDQINNSEARLLRRLSSILLPDAQQLPIPAFAILEATPTSEGIVLDERSSFFFEKEEATFYFAPAFTTRLLKTNNISVYSAKNEQKVIFNRFFIDIEIQSNDKDFLLKNTTLHFEIKENDKNKSRFFSALSECSCKINGHEISIIHGFFEDNFTPENQFFDQNLPHKKRVQNALKQRFMTITEESIFLENEGNNVLTIEIILPFEVKIDNIEENLMVNFNRFPVLNRKLNSVEKYFQEPNIDVIQIPANGHFSGIFKVINRNTMEDIPSSSISKFKEENKLCYSIRNGGTGRYDEYNLWQQFSYLLSVYRGEHRNQELVQNLGGNISIEELHEWIGKNIDKQKADAVTGLSNNYVYIHTPIALKREGLETKVEYWTSNGAAANNLPLGLLLQASNDTNGIDEKSISFITVPQNGSDTPNDNQKIDNLKDLINRRERITTIKDIKNYCKHKLGDALQDVKVETDIEVLPHANKSLQKIMLISLSLNEDKNHDYDTLLNEMEIYINENALPIIKYRIQVTA